LTLRPPAHVVFVSCFRVAIYRETIYLSYQPQDDLDQCRSMIDISAKYG